jgi:hypothetical protein
MILLKTDDLRAKVHMLERIQAGNNTNPNAHQDMNVLRGVLVQMSRKIDEIIANSHDDAVKFNGFCFRRYEDATAWLESHSPYSQFGMIVDVHMVFEQVNSGAAKTLPTLQLLWKIDMTDLSQGVAVSSLDYRIPKLLSYNVGYTAVDTDVSSFDKIKTYKEWYLPSTGLRDQLKKDLNAFELSHKQMILNNTIPSSPLQTTASLSRTYSLPWI